MLDFIVLGRVPGTHFNITINWILAVFAVGSLFGALISYYWPKRHKIARYLFPAV